MLDAGTQAEFEHRAQAEHIGPANVGIRLDEARVGGKVVDRVDPFTKPVKLRIAQAEAFPGDFAGHHPQPLFGDIRQDFRLFQGVPQPREPLLDTPGTD